jgi:hypothetical protein
MNRGTLTAWVVVGVLAAPAVVPLASARPLERQEDRRAERRYYDRDHRDYHVWNNREDRAYRRYLEERHERYREFGSLRARRQVEYWRWRHIHPEFDIEIRR